MAKRNNNDRPDRDEQKRQKPSCRVPRIILPDVPTGFKFKDFAAKLLASEHADARRFRNPFERADPPLPANPVQFRPADTNYAGPLRMIGIGGPAATTSPVAISSLFARPPNPFGSPSPGVNPFGSPSPGSNPFGNPSPGVNPFGNLSPGVNPFGSPSPGSNPFGNPSPGANPFGNPSLPANPFGNPPPSANPFGNPSPPNPFGNPPVGSSPFSTAPRQPSGPSLLNPFGRPTQSGGSFPYTSVVSGSTGTNPFGGPPQSTPAGPETTSGSTPFVPTLPVPTITVTDPSGYSGGPNPTTPSGPAAPVPLATIVPNPFGTAPEQKPFAAEGKPFTTPWINSKPAFMTPQPKTFPAPKYDVVAPIEFTMEVLNRVYSITQLIWRERLRDMALPILRAPEFFCIHEAHCFNLGSFRHVIQEPLPIGQESDKDVAEWLFTRMTHDNAIRAMVRYSVMLLYFEILTVNGATGKVQNPPTMPFAHGKAEERYFSIYFNDPNLSDEDSYVLRRFQKSLSDQRSGNAMVGVEICATNGTEVPTGRRIGHRTNCHCDDPEWNHFVYVADGKYEGLAGSEACRMPTNPAVVMGGDFLADDRHNRHCAKIPASVQFRGPDAAPIKIVPRTTEAGNPCACGIPDEQAGKIPKHLRHGAGYLKYCTHIHAGRARLCPTCLPITHPPTLANTDALYIRRDLFGNLSPEEFI